MRRVKGLKNGDGFRSYLCYRYQSDGNARQIGTFCGIARHILRRDWYFIDVLFRSLFLVHYTLFITQYVLTSYILVSGIFLLLESGFLCTYQRVLISCFFLLLLSVLSPSRQVTDYGKIVTAKMDLDTVKARHKNTRYGHVDAFFGDLFPVYDNAIRYFEQGGKHRNKIIYEAAKVRGVLERALLEHLHWILSLTNTGRVLVFFSNQPYLVSPIPRRVVIEGCITMYIRYLVHQVCII